MSGPLYPPGPQPGSNAIGEFIIGVSPIGDIVPFNFWDTIISQYANSPILTTLIENFDAYIDQSQNFDNFFDLLWNVDTAQGYGLDVWGRIVGVTRTLDIQNSGAYFDFAEAEVSGNPFNQQPFYLGAPLTTNYQLSDDDYRTLILAKAAYNISDGSIPSINAILLTLFPNRGNCYVVDGLNMTMQYYFGFALTPVELAIVSQSGVLPRPAGVQATIVQAL